MPITPSDATTSPFKELLSKRITQFVLWGTIIIAVTGLAFAIVALNIANQERIKSAINVLQYVFGALLPLWGTWIGTVIAYYYSKENFESANKSVQQLVEKITSDKKLQSVKAFDVMIGRDKLIAKTLPAGNDLSFFKLKEDGIEFLAANNIKRVIILNDKDAALYATHKELIASFIANETLNGNTVTNYTFQDLFDKSPQSVKDIINNSVKFIGSNATLWEAKQLMDQHKTCQDVFVTATGKPDEPVLGWITNVTIAENAIV